MMIRGNALLSSVYVKSITPGATLKVNYWDTTTGDEDTGERFDLASHPIIDDTAAGKTFRIIVPRIHNKVLSEVVVTGGAVEFGVYITVVDAVVSEIDSALVFDGTTFVPTTHKAIPTAYYDEASGTLKFFRVLDGALVVTTENGIPKTLAIAGTFTDNTVQDLLAATVPAGKKWQILSASLSTRAYTNFKLYSNAVLQGGGFTGAAESNVRIALDEKPEAVAGQEVKIAGQKTGGPNNDFIATIRLREISV